MFRRIAFSIDRLALVTVPSLTVAVLIEAYVRTDIGDASSADESQYFSSNELIRHKHVEDLESDKGFVVLSDVLTRDELKCAQNDISQLMKSGYFEESQHGNDSDVRQDRICWVYEETFSKIDESEVGMKSSNNTDGNGLLHCIKLLRGVTKSLENKGYNVSHSHLIPKQCQLAVYKGDSKAGYRRHLDRCHHTIGNMGLLEWLRASDYRNRVITVILYLNSPTWNHGGQLRCYHKNPEQEEGNDSYEDILPKGGTMIIFDSSRIEHSVQPSTKNRIALTCWVNGVLA